MRLRVRDQLLIVCCFAAATVTIVRLDRDEVQSPPHVYVNPRVSIDASTLALAIAALPNYDRDPDTGQILGWPDNEGISEDAFLEDCRDVCVSRRRITRPRPGEPVIVPRVLYADAEHLVCVCLDGYGYVARYVGWQRR